MSKIFLNKLRYQYKKGELKQENMHDDPVLQFNDWFNQVLKTDLLDPNAMHLSTVCESNKPNNRVVLLKQFDQKGFVFFTNFNSKKGDHIAKNPNVCLTFYWRNLERQVRVEGRASQIEDFLSDEYFQTRSRESQLAAWSSNQSSKIASRVELENKIKDYGIKYPNIVPRPPFWGGYQVVPSYFEFWQGRADRNHDRITYNLHGDSWKMIRLSP